MPVLELPASRSARPASAGQADQVPQADERRFRSEASWYHPTRIFRPSSREDQPRQPVPRIDRRTASIHGLGHRRGVYPRPMFHRDPCPTFETLLLAAVSMSIPLLRKSITMMPYYIYYILFLTISQQFVTLLLLQFPLKFLQYLQG